MVEERWEQGGGVGLTQACIGPAVDSQLLRHHNKQRPHRGQPSGRAEQQCGALAGSAARLKREEEESPNDQFLHCRYGNRAVSIGPQCEEYLAAFFSSLPLLSLTIAIHFHPPAPFSVISPALLLLSPPFSGLPSTLLLSPAPLEQINSCLSLTLSKCGCNKPRFSGCSNLSGCLIQRQTATSSAGFL